MEIGPTYYVYILSNKRRTVLYTGRTHDLSKRMIEHKQKLVPKSFTARYNIDRLIYFEKYGDEEEAKQREYQIKAGSRQKKIDLIRSINPDWKDLSN